MKKQTLRLLSAALILTILLACVPAVAENGDKKDGEIVITVGTKKSEFKREGIQLGLYLLATGDYGDWTMVSHFKDITIYTRKDGSTSVGTKLNKIIKRIGKDNIKPTKKAKTDKNGVAEFKNLRHGIYLMVMLKGPEGLKMDPILLAVPNEKGKLRVPADANKLTYTTPTPSPTPTKKPTPTPWVPTGTPSVPTRTPAPPTPTPVVPTPDKPDTPYGPRGKQTPLPGEEEIPDYETALGLGNIQMHVGVCFD